MRTFLLDTMIASWLFDEGHLNHAVVKRFFASHPDAIIHISSITVGQIRYGYMVHTNADKARKQLIEKNLQQYTVRDVDRHVATAWATIRAEVMSVYGSHDQKNKIKEKDVAELLDKTNGKTLGFDETDLWIVAVAVTYNYEFATDDAMARLRAITTKLYPNVIWCNPRIDNP